MHLFLIINAMKIINLQDYQKDKAIENVKEIIQDMSIDENIKMVLIGLLDIDLMSFKHYVETSNILHKVIASSNELSDTVKRHTDTLYQDIPRFMESANELLKEYQEEIIALKNRVKQLEEKTIC
jgi:hypothetical protein